MPSRIQINSKFNFEFSLCFSGLQFELYWDIVSERLIFEAKHDTFLKHSETFDKFAKCCRVWRVFDKTLGKCFEFGKYHEISYLANSSMASHLKKSKTHFGTCKYLPKMLRTRWVLQLAKFAREQLFLNNNKKK
jgi:hypothetical protein